MAEGSMLGPTEGTAVWFAGALMVVKASEEQTAGAFSLLDQTAPAGYAPPRHVHQTEDEAWYVLDGNVEFFCGDQTLSAGALSFVFLPKNVPHTFKVRGDSGARLLTLSVPGTFASFVVEAGEPAPSLTIPPPGPPDVERLTEIGARYDIQIVGPPPD
jgi:quercetin dioxygenase-like cupin family protein